MTKYREPAVLNGHHGMPILYVIFPCVAPGDTKDLRIEKIIPVKLPLGVVFKGLHLGPVLENARSSLDHF